MISPFNLIYFNLILKVLNVYKIKTLFIFNYLFIIKNKKTSLFRIIMPY